LVKDGRAAGNPPPERIPLVEFWDALYPANCKGFLELRALPSRAQDFLEPRDDQGIRRFQKRHVDENLFFGVAMRRESGDGSLANCVEVWALWCDIDFKTLPEDEARRRLTAFPLAPSIVVHSGGGLHAYWLLRTCVTVQQHQPRLKAGLRRLAYAVGGDLSAAEPARVLRVPGTLNYKYEPPRRVAIESLEPKRLYEFDQIEAATSAEPRSQASTFRMPELLAEGTRNTSLYRLARSLRAKGLSDAAILAALLEENRTKCNPPLPDDEVRQLAQHVVGQPDRPEFTLGNPHGLEHFEDSGNSGHPLAWDAPTPFHETILPSFPTGALPDWLAEYVEGIATETQTPPDLAALVTLSVVAASCARVVQVEARSGWVEPLNVFAVIAMDPGNRKSAVFSAAVGPLSQAEKFLNQERAPEIIASHSRYEAARQRLKEAETALKKASPEERMEHQEDVERCASQLSEIKIPPTCRRLADDITPEKVASLLAEQDERLAIMSAEGDIFDTMAGRYGASGMSNLGVFLKGYSGDSIRVDRMGRIAEYVERPALTICLTVQPEVIRGLHRRPEFRGRGLLARFFYAIPHSRGRPEH
jgi:hypothetical protein